MDRSDIFKAVAEAEQEMRDNAPAVTPWPTYSWSQSQFPGITTIQVPYAGNLCIWQFAPFSTVVMEVLHAAGGTSKVNAGMPTLIAVGKGDLIVYSPSVVVTGKLVFTYQMLGAD